MKMLDRVRALIAVIGMSLTLVLAACTSSGTPVASPTAPASAAAPTAVAATTAPTTAPAITAAAATTVPPTTPATATTAPAATRPAAAATQPAAADATTAGATRLTLAADSSEARYRIKEQLVGRSLPNDAVGSTKAVTGTIVLGPNGAVMRDQSKITIDLSTLKSDESRRDNFLQRSVLQTTSYPTAEFVPTEVRGLPNPLPTSGTATFELAGDLTVKGVTRPTVWQTAATFAPTEVTGTATTSLKLTDFGIEPPRVGPVLSIEDELRLELDVHAARSSAVAEAVGATTGT